MEKASKDNSGLRKVFLFTTAEQREIIEEMIAKRCSKREIWEKYTGEPVEHGQILRWMHQLGYSTAVINKTNLVENNKKIATKELMSKVSDESFETLQLKKRILELENQLKDAEMKAIAFSTMVDIAEKQFNIPIRKKVNTKPLKK